MKRDDLADLAVFLAVADAGSFTAAAVQLGVSQSAVSHAMRRLEASLGFRLLNRTTRNVSTTDLGEKLLGSLRPGFVQIENHIEELRSLKNSPSGVVRLTTSTTAARLVLWSVVTELVRDYPDIQVEINTSSLVVDLAEGRFDGAVRLGESVGPDLIAIPVSPPVALAAVASPDYLRRRGVPQHPNDLDDHACIAMRFGPESPVYDWEFEREGQCIERRISGPFIFNEGDMCVQAALEGHGICCVLLSELQVHLDSGRLQRVLADWCEPFAGFQLCFSSRRHMSSSFRILADRLRYRAESGVGV